MRLFKKLTTVNDSYKKDNEIQQLRRSEGVKFEGNCQQGTATVINLLKSLNNITVEAITVVTVPLRGGFH